MEGKTPRISATAHNAWVNEDGTITVQVLKGPMDHGQCCYQTGDCFTVPRNEGTCYLKPDYHAQTYECPFKPYCQEGDIGAKPLEAYRDAIVLAAGVATEVNVPCGLFSCDPAYVVFTSCGGCVWANYGVDEVVEAAVPTADITDGTAPEMNPHIRVLSDEKGNQVCKMSLVSNADTIVQLEYFGV